MPTYEYSCDTCEARFDWVQSFSDDALKKCPGKRSGGPASEACTAPGKGKVKKIFSAVGISFKGDGFYKNDHGSSSKRNESSGKSSKESGDSKSSSDSGSSSSSSSGGEKSTGSSGEKSDSAPSPKKKDSKTSSTPSSSSKTD